MGPARPVKTMGWGGPYSGINEKDLPIIHDSMGHEYILRDTSSFRVKKDKCLECGTEFKDKNQIICERCGKERCHI